jgi:DNA modification methylase
MFLDSYIPNELKYVKFTQNLIPKIAKDNKLIGDIENAIVQIPTIHNIHVGDSRKFSSKSNGVHLILTSPPYWTLKVYPPIDGQLGLITEYDNFTRQLDIVWRKCFRELVPGGRLICVVGDVCLSRKANNGIHTVIPLHSTIQEHLIKIGFSNLAPIIWYKITNASYEAEGSAKFLGKPYEPGGIVKNDIEYIIMARKPGSYRKVDEATRLLSVISEANHREWFQQIWTGITGASTKDHPAPFPPKLAERLIRMFSFVGDTVLDPFMGTGTTNVAAARWGRNSIGVEIDKSYFEIALNRLEHEKNIFQQITINAIEQKERQQ